MSQTEGALRVRADRRVEGSWEIVRDALMRVGQGIEGVRVELGEREAFEAAPDAGAFRDFVEVGVLWHVDLEALEYAAEWLIDEFDWVIDVARPAYLA